MENRDHARRAQQPDIGVQEDLLDHFELTAVTTTRRRPAKGGLLCILLRALIKTGDHVELPVLHIIEGNAQRHGVHGGIQLSHVTPELPKRVHKKGGIVPSILASAVSCPGGLQLHVLADSGMYLAIPLRARVGDHRHGEVGVVMRHDLDVRSIILFRLLVLLRSQEVLQLSGLFLGKILVERAEEVNRAIGTVVFRCRIELLSSETNKEVSPEGSILLNLLGDLDGRVDFSGIAEVSERKVLFVEYKRVFWKRAKSRDDHRRRKVDAHVQRAVGRPDGDDEIRNRAVVCDFGAGWAVRERGHATGIGTGSSILLAGELADHELGQHENAQALDDGPERGLE